LQSNPHLRRHLKRCRHCRIFFLTESSNITRTDLGCPFGCSALNRKREASRRSAAYYRTKEGRRKKRALNQRRYLVYPAKESEPESKEDAMAEENSEESIIEHVRMVTSLIEGREVSLDEIKEMLKHKERQRSLTRQRRVDYPGHPLNKDPP
jgi:hypothetical protein